MPIYRQGNDFTVETTEIETLTRENLNEIRDLIEEGGIFIPNNLGMITAMAKDEVEAYTTNKANITLSPTLTILYDVILYFTENPDESLEPLDSEESYLEFIQHFDIATEGYDYTQAYTIMMDKLQTYQKASQ